MAAVTGITPKLLEPPVTSSGNPVSGTGFVNFNPPNAADLTGWKGDPITGLNPNDNDAGPGPGMGPGPGSIRPFNKDDV